MNEELKDVTRVVYIDKEKGRVLDRTRNLEFQIQDEGKTLKIFDKGTLEKPEETCPVCGWSDFEDISPKSSNGVLGPGHYTHKMVDLRVCTHCRVVINLNI